MNDKNNVFSPVFTTDVIVKGADAKDANPADFIFAWSFDDKRFGAAAGTGDSSDKVMVFVIVGDSNDIGADFGHGKTH